MASKEQFEIQVRQLGQRLATVNSRVVFQPPVINYYTDQHQRERYERVLTFVDTGLAEISQELGGKPNRTTWIEAQRNPYPPISHIQVTLGSVAYLANLRYAPGTKTGTELLVLERALIALSDDSVLNRRVDFDTAMKYSRKLGSNPAYEYPVDLTDITQENVTELIWLGFRSSVLHFPIKG